MLDPQGEPQQPEPKASECSQCEGLQRSLEEKQLALEHARMQLKEAQCELAQLQIIHTLPQDQRQRVLSSLRPLPRFNELQRGSV